MQIKLQEVIASLHSWAKVHYKGDQMKMTRLTSDTLRTETRIIKETGMGVPPEQYLNKATAEMKAVAMLAQTAPPWATGLESAKGQAALDVNNPNKAQAKLMAIRGAELDARRKLAEKIEGLMITSKTSVRDFVAENDEINTSMMAFQAGGYVVEGSQTVDGDVATVTVEIDMKPLWNSVIFYKKKLGLTLQ
jgi:hypothetical protein